MPTTTSSGASIGKSPALLGSLIYLNAQSSPMQPRGMEAMSRADTTNRTPPSIATSPLYRTRLEDGITFLLARTFPHKRMMAPKQIRYIPQMDDSTAGC